jgi:hypothetical protein
VNAAIPFEDMNDLFYKKMETREYFKALGAALKSPEFKVISHCFYWTLSAAAYVMWILLCEFL